jgi:hypothetical protein
MADLAREKAQGIKEVYDEAIASGKEYLNKILYACVALGALYVIRKPKAPERVMDGGETKQNEETKQSEPRQPRPRAKTPIRHNEMLTNQDDEIVTNQDVFELDIKILWANYEKQIKRTRHFKKHKTPKKYFWIKYQNNFIRLKTKDGYYERTHTTLWSQPLSLREKFTKTGHIDGNGVLNFF